LIHKKFKLLQAAKIRDYDPSACGISPGRGEKSGASPPR